MIIHLIVLLFLAGYTFLACLRDSNYNRYVLIKDQDTNGRAQNHVMQCGGHLMKELSKDEAENATLVKAAENVTSKEDTVLTKPDPCD